MEAELNWNLTYREAVALQDALRNKVSVKSLGRAPRLVAGIDVSVTRKEDIAFAAVVVMEYESLRIVEKVVEAVPISFPYIPGLLAFREGPPIIAALKKIDRSPDLLIFDGHGICHPRGMGIASLMGLVVGKPSIGCAKSHFYGEFAPPSSCRGAWSPVRTEGGTQIGMVLRTRDGKAPVFVSPGHMTDFTDCRKIILHLAPRYRLPEPMRAAHHESITARRACFSGGT
jgi:deoxyribonuclease V